MSFEFLLFAVIAMSGGTSRGHRIERSGEEHPARVAALRLPNQSSVGRFQNSRTQVPSSGFSRAAEIHGPTASQLRDLASCLGTADPTRVIHRREQPRKIPGEQVPLGNDPLHDQKDAIFAARTTDASKRPGRVNSWVASLSRSG